MSGKEDNIQPYEVRDIRTIRELLESSAQLFSEKPAYKVKAEKGGEYIDITFKEFKEDVWALGTYLIEKGLKGKRIGIIGSNCYEWVVAYFAIVCGAGIAVPLDKELSKEEIYNLSSRADLSAVLYTGKYDEIFEGMDIDMKIKMSIYEVEENKTNEGHIRNAIEDGRTMIADGSKVYDEVVIDPDVMAVLLFTSGTTGNPKGVMLSNTNLCHDVMVTSMICKLHDDDVSLSILPIHHTFEGTINLLTVGYQGACVAFCEGLKYILKNIQEAGVSIMIGVPLIVESVYSKIWKTAEKNGKAGALRKLISVNKALMKLGIDQRRRLFSSVYKNLGGKLRLFVVGAASLEPQVARGIMDLGFDIVLGYGLTETAPLISGTPEFMRNSIYAKSGSCGPVVPLGEMKLINVDEEGIGEFAYRGRNIMLGYYGMPDETAKVIDEEGWFHTGDLGFMDEKGWVHITGRSKNVIVTKTGKNIYPEELEILVNALPQVTESMVYGKEEDGGRDYIGAVQILPDMEYIKEHMGEDVSEEEVFEMFREEIYQINKSLPDYKRIRNIIVRKEDFVRTTTKKIKRQANL